jgi:hypothetical protein
MELTKEYFDEQLKNVATKNDVNAINQRIDSLSTHTDLEKFAVKDDLDHLKKFLDENMVTKQELQDLREELPTRADFNQLQTSVDGIAKQFLDHKQEQIVGASRASRMEAWIVRAAAKIGVEYKP